MRMLNALSIILLAAAPLAAQRPTSEGREAQKQGQQFIVRTVPLRHLTSSEAVKLLSPYSQTSGGGVFDTSPSVRAVTIRETMAIYLQMMAVLSQYDREPATVTLSFQLVSADNSNRRDASVAGLDSLLRGVLKFSGYKLLATAVVNVGERSTAIQTLNADGQDYKLSYEVHEVSVDGANASIQLRVSLNRSGMITANGLKSVDPLLLSTGVTIPIGNTVVLGSAVNDGGAAVTTGDKALILTVRPQMAPVRKE